MAHRVAIINGKQPSGGVGGVSDADFSNIAVNILQKGVVGVNHYKVEEQASPNMTVKVNTGKAYVSNALGTMMYLTDLDTAATVNIASNASGFQRIDAVVLKVDVGVTPDNFAGNVATLMVVQGTASASPTAPSDSDIQTAVGAANSYYRLANVTVDSGATSITNAKISNTRSGVTIKLVGGYIRYNLSTLRLEASNDGSSFSDVGGGSSDGWISSGETWTYASATTFTVSGDVTAKFQKGTRIKLTQSSTVKYFAVVASSHSAGTTTVTITGGTDYTLTNSAITNNYYSYIVSPQGYPDWFNYTPTWGGFSAAPAVNSARFRVVGSACTLAIAASFGTSNATNLTISLPVNAALTQYAVSLAADQGAYAAAAMETGAGSGTLTVYKNGAFAAFTASGNKVAQISGFTYQI
jgi:uncharacterized protein YbbK (DUF523 family)